jgi:hypothetical protein
VVKINPFLEVDLGEAPEKLRPPTPTMRGKIMSLIKNDIRP